ncbi:tetratricopeptide repeat protein [Caldilinea sp.]|uniref:ATP-binding protein n=1 Tax=Caldilinea sp. TaxID=2293560 RepID=UPI0021DBC108|nr:tetratricopeptide repeat protein [Caldilinea sp.]GIV69760.1 MAG: serine/threonine protein kinase [Caldilinea sp.]
MAASHDPFITFSTCGELLKFLRRRAHLSLRELSIQIGYSESHLSRIENNERTVDRTSLLARFVPALHLQHEPEIVARLLALCDQQVEPPPSAMPLSPDHGPPLPSPPPAEESAMPSQLTSFIGRVEEIVEVCKLLQDQNVRLLTLTGAGGCGKTRLALRVGEEMAPFYPDGVQIVELAALVEPHLLPTVLATTVGLSKVSDSAALLDFLRPSQQLFILDNCEHLVNAVAELAVALLLACPRLQILTTSREALAVPGEFVYRIQPLALPTMQAGMTPSAIALLQYDAIRLFVERARAASHAFRLTDQNAAAVASICHRLDGMPLCIELAAAWVAVLTPEQIAARLEHDFSLLASAGRRPTLRHQTLQAAIDWSYRLLAEPERTLLRRLSVFRGGWTLEAAEAIAADEEGVQGMIAPHQVLMLLRRLINKSLVVVESSPESGARYRLLEPVREVLHAKLSASGEAPALQRRHLGYYARLAEAAELELSGANQPAWLERLETEHDNLRAALKWGCEQRGEPAQKAAHLAARIWRFWLVRGHYAEGRHWLEQALSDGHPSDTVRLRLLYGAGVLARLQIDLNAARRFAEEQLHLARRLDDRQGIADGYGVLGWIEEFLGNYQTALNCFTERLTLSRALNNSRGIAYALRGLGETATSLGRYGEAEAWLHEALTIFLQLGDQRYVAQIWNDLGVLAHHANRPGIAAPYFQLSLAVHRRLDDKHGVAMTLLHLSRCAALQQDIPGAVAYHDAATQQVRGAADRLLQAALWSNQARLAFENGNCDEADVAAAQALRLRRELNHRPGVVEDLEQCAATALARRHATRAVCLWSAAEHFRTLMQMPLPLSDQTLHAQRLALAHSQLTQAEFLAAWQAGGAMSWEQATIYAIGE